MSSFASAQTPLAAASFNVDASPRIPGPNEEVTLTLTWPGVDLDRASVRWSLDGRIKRSGRGIKTFTFTTGALGSTSVVGVSVTAQNGAGRSDRLVFNPADVDLLWEADTYTPPFYRGKALPTPESTVRITAVPHFLLAQNGARVPADEIIYTWSQDRRVLGSKSGFGKQSLEITMPRTFRTTEVIVEASSLKNSFVARKGIRLTPVAPFVLFYERQPLFGILSQRAFPKNVTLRSEEATLRAEPFYFSRDDLRNGNTTFSWSLNEESVFPGAKQNELTVRREGDEEGSARLSLVIENTAKLLQAAIRDAVITFGRESRL